MTKRLVQRRTALLAAAGTVVLLAVVAVPVAAGGNGHGNGNGNGNTQQQQQQSATGSRNRHGAAWRRRPVAHPVPDPRPQQRQELEGLGSDADLDVLVHRLGLLGLVHDGGGDDRLRRRSPDVVRRHRLRGSVLRLLDPQGRADGSRLLVGLVVCFSGSRPGRLREPGSLASDAVRARRCLRSVQGLTLGSRNNGTGGAAAAPPPEGVRAAGDSTPDRRRCVVGHPLSPFQQQAQSSHKDEDPRRRNPQASGEHAKGHTNGTACTSCCDGEGPSGLRPLSDAARAGAHHPRALGTEMSSAGLSATPGVSPAATGPAG